MDEWLNAHQIERLTGIPRSTIRQWGASMAKVGQIKTLPRGTKSVTRLYSPVLIRKIIRRHKQLERYGQSSGITLVQAAEILGVSRPFAARLLRNLKRTPALGAKNQVVAGYLRRDVLQVAANMHRFAELDECSETDLTLLTGWSRRTVVRRLSQQKVRPLTRRSPSNGHIGTFYRVDEAQAAIGPPRHKYIAGGCWYTAEAASASIGRPISWLKPRLSRLIFASAFEWRLDDGGRLRKHYPPWVVMSLKSESAKAVLSKAS